MRLAAGMLCLIAISGCSIVDVAHEGEAIAELAVQRTVLLQADDRDAPLFQVAVLPGGELLVVGAQRAVSFSAAGQRLRETIVGDGPHYPLRYVWWGETGTDGRTEPGFVGVARDGRSVGVYAADGQVARRLHVPALPNITIANVTGDATPELVIQHDVGEGVEVFDRTGQSLGRVEAPGYVTDFDVLPGPSDEARGLVFYLYPVGEGGRFVITGLDGTVRQQWDDRPLGAFALLSWQGRTALVSAPDEAYRVVAPGGEVLGSFAARTVRRVGRILSCELAGGRRVFVSSSRGGPQEHTVSIFDAGGRLVYHDRSDEDVQDLQPLPDRNGFYLVTRRRLARFTVSG